MIVLFAENVQSSTPDNSKLVDQRSQLSIPNVRLIATTNQSSQSSTSTRQINDIDKIFPKCNTKLQKALQSEKFLGYDEKKAVFMLLRNT